MHQDKHLNTAETFSGLLDSKYILTTYFVFFYKSNKGKLFGFTFPKVKTRP